jgi:uncharacterized protein with ATP-grasp and redox domains
MIFRGDVGCREARLTEDNDIPANKENICDNGLRTAPMCISCLLRLAEEAISLARPGHKDNEALYREVLNLLAAADWDVAPPVLCQLTQRIIRGKTGCPDPYRRIKERLNRESLRVMGDLISLKPETMSAREAAVRIAIGGNSLDAATKSGIRMPEAVDAIKFIYQMSLAGDWTALFSEACRARNILYLTDNAGEIVFDRALISELPAGKVTVAVRGAAVINDATLEDAAAAGLGDLALVVSNGSDAPGTLLEDCSPDFRELFGESDMIIAKGQGNYETLCSAKRGIFFLFQVKCGMVAAHTGLPIGTMVIRRHKGRPE